MDKLTFLTFIIGLCYVRAKVEVTEIRGPDYVEYGTTEEIILDCDFKIDGAKDLVLKWFLDTGDGTKQVYQWIPEFNKLGQAKGVLKGRVDTDYQVTNDTNTMYRALKIFNITTEISGNYTCVVSTLEGESSKSKEFTVFIPPKSGLELILLKNDQTVICSIHGVYPQPQINLYLVEGDKNKTGVEEFTNNNTVEYQREEDSGTYNVTKVYTFQNLSSFTGNVKFICDLDVPGTKYYLRESLTYQTVDATVVNTTLNEEGDISNLNDTISSTEIYYPNISEGNAGVTNIPGASLSAILTVFLLVLCK